MLDYGFANYALVTPRLNTDNPVPVKLGTAERVRAVPGEDTQLLVEKGQQSLVIERGPGGEIARERTSALWLAGCGHGQITQPFRSSAFSSMK